MYCSKCGNECREGTKFCNKCGAPLIQPQDVKVTESPKFSVVQNMQGAFANQLNYNPSPMGTMPMPQQKKKSKFPKIPCLIGAGIVVVLLVVVLFVVKAKGKNSSSFEFISENAVTIIHEELDYEDYYLFVNGKGQIIYADYDNNIEDLQLNATQDVVAFHTNDYDKLCVLKDNKVIKISEDAFDYVLSSDGSKIAYLEDEERDYGTLYVRNLNKKEPVKIAEKVNKNSVVLSPKGNTVALAVRDEEGDLAEIFMLIGDKTYSVIKAEDMEDAVEAYHK